MDEEMERTIIVYNRSFNKMFSLIKTLPKWGSECTCPEADHTFYCYDGHAQLSENCCECGGNIEHS